MKDSPDRSPSRRAIIGFGLFTAGAIAAGVAANEFGLTRFLTK